MTYKEFIDDILNTRGRFACGEEYHERHHILPKCLNGTDGEDNLIDLFAREHYEAHKLLAQENPDNCSLQFAWNSMRNFKAEHGRQYEISAEDYEQIKTNFSKSVSQLMKDLWADPDHRAKRMVTLGGETVRQKMSQSAKRRLQTPEGQKHIKEMWSDIEKRKLISKTTLQFTKTGEFVNEYFAATEASRQTGIARSSIMECCQGKRKSAGGFVWKYKND